MPEKPDPDQLIPDAERWLHTPDMRARLERALDWSESHPRSETNLDSLAAKVRQKQ